MAGGLALPQLEQAGDSFLGPERQDSQCGKALCSLPPLPALALPLAQKWKTLASHSALEKLLLLMGKFQGGESPCMDRAAELSTGPEAPNRGGGGAEGLGLTAPSSSQQLPQDPDWPRAALGHLCL